MLILVLQLSKFAFILTICLILWKENVKTTTNFATKSLQSTNSFGIECECCFNNIINKCWITYFMIGNVSVCKASLVKFVVSSIITECMVSIPPPLFFSNTVIILCRENRNFVGTERFASRNTHHGIRMFLSFFFFWLCMNLVYLVALATGLIPSWCFEYYG